MVFGALSEESRPGFYFLAHIKEGIESTARDDEALLLFSGGETRKDAGPRSEAQSYWAVAESKEWFGMFTYSVLYFPDDIMSCHASFLVKMFPLV